MVEPGLDLESAKNKAAEAYKNRRKAIGIFQNEEEFQRFLKREDFIKKLSALSYLESVKKNQGKYVVHLYFRTKNRLTALTTTFAFGEFQADPFPKRKEFKEKNQLSKFIRDFQHKNNIEEVIKKCRRSQPAVQKKQNSFLLAEDNKTGQGRGLKRVKVEQLPSDQKKKNLPDLSDTQILCQENQKLRQGLRHLRSILKNVQPSLPPTEAQKVQEELENMQYLFESPCVSQIGEEDAFNLDGKDLLDDHDHDQSSNISNFFAKENDNANQGLLRTSPVLVPAYGVVGAPPSTIDKLMEEERGEKRKKKKKTST